MGNTCENEDFNKLQIFTSTNQKAIKNLQKYPNQVPPKQFAVLVTNIPTIDPNIEEILQKQYNNQLKDNGKYNRQSLVQDNQGIEFPWFYILHKQSYYKGQWKNHLPNGKGQAYFNNGAYYHGNFKQGEAESQNGIFIFDDLSFYRGQIKKSTFDGKGRFQSKSGVIYQGQWKNNLPNGQGIEKFPDNNRYEGEFVNGYKQGRGRFEWNDGKVYQGEFLQGKAHGNGKLSKNKTHKFQGKFKNNKKIESGKMKTSQGIFTGSFVNGLPHQSGIFEWKNKNMKYEGQFNEGRIQGEGVLVDKNGKTYYGIWKDGELIEELQLKRSRSKSKSRSKIVSK